MFTKMARVTLLVVLLPFCDCANILAVLPVPCYSHQISFRPLTQELVKQGHHVTVITPFPAFNGSGPANLTEISILKTIDKLTEKALKQDMKVAYDIVSQEKIAFNAVKDIFDLLIGGALKDFIRSGKKFDLILAEACARPSIVFSHIFKAPVIQVSSFGGTFDTFSIVGAPIHPLLYPLAVREKFRNLTMLDKVRELYLHYELLSLYYGVEPEEDKVIRQHLGEDFPSLRELTKNIEMIFLNVHPIWDSNRPVPPNLIYLGGLHLQEEKELPPDLKSQLDSSNGAIYVSFGSLISSSILQREKIDMFLNVLSKLPYKIFWKWDADVEKVPKNVIVHKWYPQADLLRHPKMKLFVTQGGLQSIQESIDAGVPMLAIPVLWDQWYNADRLVQLEIGVMANIRSVTAEEFKGIVEHVLNDERYRKNVQNLREIINDQPQTSLEKAIWWIEYVIRHKGAKYLKSPAFEMSAIEYFEVELILSVVLLIIIVFISLIACVKCILCKKNNVKAKVD